MKVKYLREAPRGNKGDVAQVPDTQANVLIRLGIAEEYKAPVKKPSATKKKTAKTETDKSE